MEIILKTRTKFGSRELPCSVCECGISRNDDVPFDIVRLLSGDRRYRMVFCLQTYKDKISDAITTTYTCKGERKIQLKKVQ